jgi:hypothetical protein
MLLLLRACHNCPQEQQLQHEDAQFAAEPHAYLLALQQRYQAAVAVVEARKWRRLGSAAAGQQEVGAGAAGANGRRRDAKHR